jgi:hypothetical protein
LFLQCCRRATPSVEALGEPGVKECPVEAVRIDAVAVAKWLQQFLQQESDAMRAALGLAIAGHVIIALFLLLGFFERTEAASVDTMPVEIVMEQPDAPASQPPASPSAASPSNEQDSSPSIPAIADNAKKAKAPLATLDVNGVDLPKEPGHDGGDLSQDLAESSWAVAMHVAPVGPALPQSTAREPGEDEMTAIKEEKIECGAKARWQSPAAGSRKQARVIGIANDAQALALIRSSQYMTDRHINPRYLRAPQVFAETLDGARKSSVVLPPGITVNVGDVIEVDSGHVDPSDHCQYIPNVAVRGR